MPSSPRSSCWPSWAIDRPRRVRNLQRVAAGIDALLAPHERLLADQHTTYRNHACRVAAFHCMLDGSRDEVPQHVLVAAAFHDLGIWTAGTFDYLEPSVLLATGHLRSTSSGADREIVTAMIRNHHKLTPCASGCFHGFLWVALANGRDSEVLVFDLPGRAAGARS